MDHDLDGSTQSAAGGLKSVSRLRDVEVVRHQTLNVHLARGHQRQSRGVAANTELSKN